MALKLNLEKSAATLRLSLEKGGGPPPEAEVAFDVDVSGSFEALHRRGSTNDLLTRLVPWGMVFDPDRKLDVFTFSDGPENAVYVGEMTTKNYEGFVGREIIDVVQGWNGGTTYSYVIEKTLQHFGWLPASFTEPTKAAPKKKNWLSRFFGDDEPEGQPLPPPAPAKKRSICIFITDGEASDNDRTRQILRASQDRKDLVYFLFIGVRSSRGSSFTFLQEIADKYDNTGIYVVDDLHDFLQLSDEELNDRLIGDELREWLKK